MPLWLLLSCGWRIDPGSGSDSAGDTSVPDETGDSHTSLETADTGPEPLPLLCSHDGDRPPDLGQPYIYAEDPEHSYRVIQVASEGFTESYVVVYFPTDPTWMAYREGAPVVVSAIPALKDGDVPSAQFPKDFGMVEVQPVYPGWNIEGFVTTPPSDNGGPRAAASLRDAILFAAGQLLTVDGYSVGEVAGRNVCNSKVVLLAASSGGATAAQAISNHGDELLPVLLGLADHEVPSMPQFILVDSGGIWMDPDDSVDADGNGYTWDDARNLSYGPGGCVNGSCDLDYSGIAWTEDVSLNDVFPSRFDEHTSRGILYLDGDGNGSLQLGLEMSMDRNGDGRVSADEDRPLLAAFDVGADGTSDTVVYTPEAIQAAIAKGVLREDAWPPHLARSERVTEFWGERNMMRQLPQFLDDLPWWFRVSVDYSEIDHGVALTTRPHVVAVYDAFRQAGVDVRYNASDEATACEVPAQWLTRWAGEAEPGVELAETDTDLYALPEDIPNALARSLSTVSIYWDTYGPFDFCAEGAEP